MDTASLLPSLRDEETTEHTATPSSVVDSDSVTVKVELLAKTMKCALDGSLEMFFVAK